MCINKIWIFIALGAVLAGTLFTFIYVSSEKLYKEPSNEGTFVFMSQDCGDYNGHIY